MKKIWYCVKIVFICLRHGINPFLSMDKTKTKMNDRFSENEKKWVINIAEGYAKEYFKVIFSGD